MACCSIGIPGQRFYTAGSAKKCSGNNIHEVLQTKFPVSDFEIESTIEEAGRWDGRLVQRTKDGHEVIVASRQALKAEGQAILEINRDITAQLRAEDALRNAERLAAMGRMAGIIAHEINNPLEAITNAFFLLRDHPSLDEQARYYAHLGEQELLRVAHITKQTLSFYRESQKPVQLSVAELLDNVLELQTRRLQLARVTVDKRYRSRGTIQGFPSELKQVFLNLIGNAIQAMPKRRAYAGECLGEKRLEKAGQSRLYCYLRHRIGGES